ncbi:LysM peptidoglycan-binding domain-containing protein [Humibacter ginsenosidimutans]|uniref:LysM peptidoglycan-binding domain-containing protein n=1 Tax=Humibacter ginsenosidimutans TaxID=2599293 RepID=A0A5B8M0R8_9MICO|nr:LysM peptidoglycan-binding domain-containing protein [Humibacter ginsenosidimutans]QDZ13524.1 LysM peptidoglycan-binding domain-containing protein [Humibacter ginsenosidimutans]
MTTIALTQHRISAQQPRVRTRLTRRGRVVLAVLLVLPLMIGGAMFAANSAAIAGVDGTSSVTFRHVTVQSGDSLWSIAERVAPGSDPRDVVSAIVDLNGLSSSMVQAGEQLAIPHQYDGAGH